MVSNHRMGLGNIPGLLFLVFFPSFSPRTQSQVSLCIQGLMEPLDKWGKAQTLRKSFSLGSADCLGGYFGVFSLFSPFFPQQRRVFTSLPITPQAGSTNWAGKAKIHLPQQPWLRGFCWELLGSWKTHRTPTIFTQSPRNIPKIPLWETIRVKFHSSHPLEAQTKTHQEGFYGRANKNFHLKGINAFNNTSESPSLAEMKGHALQLFQTQLFLS